MDEQSYWEKKRKHQLKNHIVRKNWKEICKENLIDDYEGMWDDKLSFIENVENIQKNANEGFIWY